MTSLYALRVAPPSEGRAARKSGYIGAKVEVARQTVHSRADSSGARHIASRNPRPDVYGGAPRAREPNDQIVVDGQSLR
jgi:hypothetical protein